MRIREDVLAVTGLPALAGRPGRALDAELRRARGVVRVRSAGSTRRRGLRLPAHGPSASPSVPTFLRRAASRSCSTPPGSRVLCDERGGSQARRRRPLPVFAVAVLAGWPTDLGADAGGLVARGRRRPRDPRTPRCTAKPASPRPRRRPLVRPRDGLPTPRPPRRSTGSSSLATTGGKVWASDVRVLEACLAEGARDGERPMPAAVAIVERVRARIASA